MTTRCDAYGPRTEDCATLTADVATAMAIGAACSFSVLSVWMPLFDLVATPLYDLLSSTTTIFTPSVGVAVASSAALAPAVAVAAGSGAFAAEAAVVGLAVAGTAAVALASMGVGHAAVAATLVIATAATAGFMAFVFAVFASILAMVESLVAAVLCACAVFAAIGGLACVVAIGGTALLQAHALYWWGMLQARPTSPVVLDVPRDRTSESAVDNENAEPETVPLGVPVEDCDVGTGAEACSATSQAPRRYPDPNLLFDAPELDSGLFRVVR